MVSLYALKSVGRFGGSVASGVGAAASHTADPGQPRGRKRRTPALSADSSVINSTLVSARSRPQTRDASPCDFDSVLDRLRRLPCRRRGPRRAGPVALHFRRTAHGHAFRIILYAPDEETARKAAAAAFARIADLDATMSDYQPDQRIDALVREIRRRPGTRQRRAVFRAVARRKKPRAFPTAPST